MTTRVSADEFFSALVAGLALKGIQVVGIRQGFDTAVQKAFERLREASEEEDLDIRFRVRTHRVHGDSSVVREALAGAVQRNLVSLDNPEYQDMRLKIDALDAERLLMRNPLPRELVEKLTESFLSTVPA